MGGPISARHSAGGTSSPATHCTPAGGRAAPLAILAPFLLLPPPPTSQMAPPKKADKKPAAKTTKAAAKKGSKKRAKVSRPV